MGRSVLGALLLTSCVSATALAQSPLDPVPFVKGHVPDHMKTIVMGTRFVRSPDKNLSPGRQYQDHRVPLADFNATDHCVDQASLEVAETYFRTLGRMLEKTGYYYFIPAKDTDRLVSKCQTQHGAPPKVLSESGTKILAFGRVVPTTEAPALEETLR